VRSFALREAGQGGLRSEALMRRVARGLLLVILTLVAVIPAAQESKPAWRNAAPGRVLRLPADHVSHPEYRLEWWYYTGNLDAADGRRFGYQLTFFRVGVDPAPANPSRWAVRDLYMAHFAVTDVSAGRHRAVEKLSRPAPGWAGARSDRYHVWIDNWSVRQEGARHRLSAVSAAPPFMIDLTLEEGKPPLFHGDRGYSQKGSTPGNASHYYSLARMQTRGTIGVDGTRFEVAGASWMDHEFGTSFLEKTQVGWDWFAIQLDDRTDLMIYRLRGRDGSIDLHSSGTLVRSDGHTTPLDPSLFALAPGRRWKSTTSGASYPVEWHIDVPGSGLTLQVTPVVDAQELHAGLQTGIAYWEGAVDVSGTHDGKRVTGRGYVEMTGYSGRSMGEFLAR
jgi:predicted secreted hydrolase